MIETKTYYDQETGNLTVEYKNNLLIDYSDILGKIFVEEKSRDLPSNSRIEHIESNRINLIVNLKGRMKQVDKNRMQIPTEVAESINRVFNRFASEAMTKKSMSFEIIPLKNYDVENIKEDIKAMVENSRDLCVISDYKDYLDSKKISAEDLEKWLHDPKFVPPAGESRSMVYHRVVQWLRKIHTKDKTVVVMADADIIRLLVLACLGLDATWENLMDVAPTSWNILSYRTHWRLQTLSLPPEKSGFETTCGLKNDH